MNRRSFLGALGGATLAQSLPHTASASVWQAAATLAGPRLTHGTSRLELFASNDGYGLALSSAKDGSRIASTRVPVRVFYGLRSSPESTEVAFRSATSSPSGLHAQAAFADAHGNGWHLDFTAEPAGTDGLRCSYRYRLLEGAAENVFFEHALTPELPSDPAQTYVLMPGLLYDGNRLTEPPHAMPQLTAAEDFEVNTPVLTLALPVTVMHEKRTGRTLTVLTEPTVALTSPFDMAGFTCTLPPPSASASQSYSPPRAECTARLAVLTPVYREKHFHHDRFTPEAPQGATLSQGQQFTVRITLFAAVLPDIPAVFSSLEPLRTLVRTPFVRQNKLPLSAAATLVQNNLNDRMWCEEDGFYCNAILPDFDIHKQGCRALRSGWQLQTGWCSGVITGYAMLRLGDARSRTRALRMLDLIATQATSPSGLLWSVFANGQWNPQLNNNAFYQHLRMPSDAAFFFLKALALERESGADHPTWRQVVITNLDAFVKLWRDNNDFGHKVDRNTLKITAPHTAAAALAIAALAIGRNLPRGREYLQVAALAAEAFFTRFVLNGWIVGGPLDIPNAPDSESTTALLESFVTLYEATRDRKYLTYAHATVRQLATWIVAYNAAFPADTFCAENNIQSVGGVLANSQNHHIGPSFCTHSGAALLRYFLYSGDRFALHLLEDTISGLPQYVCTGHEIGYKLMKPGMVTEQFDMTDELRARGDMWEVCASWALTCVLLSAGELPSVFVDLKTRTLAVFDQITAKPDWGRRTLHLTNPTAYPATIRLSRGEAEPAILQLVPGACHTVPL